ncbi:SHOCT domain-containing protein [Cellulomonas alba]|uniref:SHOCT domain-containing protein n=1 Tax=Cellulomonas alba TaxID=3053467 RepID=A0ABT7SGT6_9CELL|nr:SHOCT domain-containing protein [Cellulomonas alba]MDM7855381.1 SHOCT domain-containing protein [Cellulomonas alba]
MPPIRRLGRPGLIGTAARTAVIAGTASATVGAVNRHQYNKQQESYEQQQYAAAEQQRQLEEAARQAVAQQQAAPAAAPAPAAADPDPLIAQLQQLGQLHAQGILDDAEFAAAKAKLLA